jgi:hypothetical protein
MSTLAFPHETSPAIYRSSRSTGEADKPLREALDAASKARYTAASSTQSSTRAELVNLFLECNEPNWDGQGARAISAVTLNRAAEFLDALPSSFMSPEAIPEPDGEVALAWYFGRSLQLSISVGVSGPLNFAGVIGEGRVRHGTEPFEEVVGAELLGYIHELHERAGLARRAA